MVRVYASFLLLLAACGRSDGGGRPRLDDGGVGGALAAMRPSSSHAEQLAAARSARCIACHRATGAAVSLLAPAPLVPLAAAPGFFAGGSLAGMLAGHFAGEDALALADYLRTDATPAFASMAVAPDAVARGGQEWSTLACTACHGADGIDGLGQRTDFAHLQAFLLDPALRRPDLLHDFALDEATATTLAAFLLRRQIAEPEPEAAKGLHWECFELTIDRAEPPALEGRRAVASGTTETIDLSMRTRDDHFALRFTGQLIVPATGEWTLTCGSDDCSWLWIDDQLVVANAALAPHRRRSGTVQLAAGAHALRLLYTEAEGEQSLEVLWEGPGVAKAPVPATALAQRAVELAAPSDAGATATPRAEAAAIARGRAAYAARRCGACHSLADAPLPAPAPSWDDPGHGSCPVRNAGASRAGGPELVAAMATAAARSELAAPPPPAVELAAGLLQHSCLRCHVRDGGGGLAPAARAGLAATEDLGDEGRLPPDLTAIGAHLQADWLERVLRGDARARPYVRARMPRVPAALAARLTRLFAVVDAAIGDEVEPPFDSAAVERGRVLAGSTGRNCITCHRLADRPAIGPQGMDLAIQRQRLRPAWFRSWLLHAATLRPGTRMPSFWFRDDAADRADVDALRIWSSLGELAPVPTGLSAAAGSLVLDPISRPILHGAFLEGLSARCLAVGSPLRSHYAYDLAHARLAWLWRGAFLDAAGTWSGRAGKLLTPLGTDRVVLEDLPLRDVDAPGTSASRASVSCVGQRRDAAGYPIVSLRVGDALVDDQVLPRLTANGSEFVRTLRCRRGAVQVGLAPTSGAANLRVGGAPAAPCVLRTGEAVEIVYRW